MTHNVEKDATEPTSLLAAVVDDGGMIWTRYHTDPTGNGRHWWAFGGGWRAFADLSNPRVISPGSDGAA